jgi:hypothetical protein
MVLYTVIGACENAAVLSAMSPDTAEMAALSAPVPSIGADAVLPAPARRAPPSPAKATGVGVTSASPRLGARSLLAALPVAQRQALRDCLGVLISSRTLVWVAGVATVLLFGFGPTRSAYHPPGLTGGFGPVGDVLAAPAARWDAAWYLTIAHYGYLPQLGPFTAARAAFFPLYPLLVWAVSLSGLAGALAGVVVSLVALLAALYGLHRLTTLELSTGGILPGLSERLPSAAADRRDIARLALALTAFGPMAFFLSADYSESLYLGLSIGVFLQARRGRWMWVGVLGGLAAASRSTGVLLVLPAALLYLYGPRGDRERDRDGALPRMRPRYKPRAEMLWLALIPAGLAAFIAWYWLAGGEPMAPFHAQALWGRQFAGPFVAVFDAAKAAFDGLRQILSGQSRHLYFPLEGRSPFIEAGHNLMLFAFLALALPATVGVLRRLPLAYGVYVLAALALPLSYPVATQPLMSIPRFLLVLFPLNMWLAGFIWRRRWAAIAVLALSAGSLVFFTAQFSTWHWVA